MSAFLRPRTFAPREFPPIPDLNILSQRRRTLLGYADGTYGGLPRARVTSTVATGLASKQWTTITFDTAERNVGGVWIAGSPLIVPAGFAGRWRIGAAVDVENVACNKAMRIMVNAQRQIAAKHRPGVGSPIPARITTMTSVTLDVGDFVEVECWHDYPAVINSVIADGAPALWGRFTGTVL